MESSKKNFNMDHVYCHSNTASFIRASSDATDILSILKENKQLKAMLLLHLDLIQEQSDQLMSKDKKLASLREENDALRIRIERMDRRLQAKCLRFDDCEEKAREINLKNDSENINDSIFEDRVGRIVGSHPAISNPESSYKICEETFNGENIIGESNGKFISKIILQRVSDNSIPCGTDSDLFCYDKNKTTIFEASNKDAASKGIFSQDTEDESFSCGSGEQESLRTDIEKARKRSRKESVVTTKNLYCSREWQTDKIDDELSKDHDSYKEENYTLEIPKWIVKDYTGLYSIEGTEDLSDETFLKRHAKLELDEKRRKKWDVQRIREQRTIERLKRRHYKDEVQEIEKFPEILSFYPSLESLKFIQMTEDLPVQAFGEPIPKIAPGEFSLPWKKQEKLFSFLDESKPTSMKFQKKRKKQNIQAVSGSKRSYRKAPLGQ